MVINLADILNSILQSIIFIYIADYCMEDRYKKNNIEKIIATILIFLLVYLCNYLFGNLSISFFIIHALNIVFISCIFYRKQKYSALVIHTIIYFFIALNVNVFGNLFFGFLENRVMLKNTQLLMAVTIYIPQFIMGFLILKYKAKIKGIFNKIIVMKPSISTLILINFSLDYVLGFYLIFYKNESQILRNLLSISLTIFLGITVLYFLKIDFNSYKILELNRKLYKKNVELSAIQFEYSKKINYMHDLYLMNEIGKIGDQLKGIINKNNTMLDNKLTEENNTLIHSIAKKTNSNELNIIIEENGSIGKVMMTELELYRIISNIVNNAVKAMNGCGILIIRTYDLENNILIIIENNGPKIEKENIYKIFKPGFTTKNNSNKNHGYGLSIVKELIEKYNGTINLTSDENSTKFKITLPLKIDNTY